MKPSRAATAAEPSLATTVAGIRFANPVLAAPGSLGFGREVQGVVNMRAYGGFITKSVTLDPRDGPPRPHIVEVEGGWLNSLGLRNPGLAAFIYKDLPFLRTLGIPIIVSIAGHSVEEFQQITEVLDDEEGPSALEVNVSCPNVRAGRRFGSDPALAGALVTALRRMTRRPLFVKLTPLVTDITLIARAAMDAGADALCCVNTLPGLAIDAGTRRPLLGAGTGGLSGPALRPLAVWSAWRVARSVPLPVIGAGGIRTAADALEFLLAGARAVAVATAAIADPDIPQRIETGLRQYLRERGIPDIAGVIGTVEGLEEGGDGGA